MSAGLEVEYELKLGAVKKVRIGGTSDPSSLFSQLDAWCREHSVPDIATAAIVSTLPLLALLSVSVR